VDWLTLVTEFIGMTAALAIFGVSAWLTVLGVCLLMSAMVLSGRYWIWEKLAMGFCAVNLGLHSPPAFQARAPRIDFRQSQVKRRGRKDMLDLPSQVLISAQRLKEAEAQARAMPLSREFVALRRQRCNMHQRRLTTDSLSNYVFSATRGDRQWLT
jgi:hypothetical protein